MIAIPFVFYDAGCHTFFFLLIWLFIINQPSSSRVASLSLSLVSKLLSILMMFFQPGLGWSVLELLGRSAVSRRRAPLQKRETKRIDGGSPVFSPMPKSVLSGGRKDQLLRE